MQRLHLKQSLLLQLPLPGLSLASPKRENAQDKSSERRGLASQGFPLIQGRKQERDHSTISFAPWSVLHYSREYKVSLLDKLKVVRRKNVEIILGPPPGPPRRDATHLRDSGAC